MFAMGQRRQAIDARLGHEDDAAAVAAVAAVGSAARNEFLAAKAEAAVAPFAGRHEVFTRSTNMDRVSSRPPRCSPAGLRGRTCTTPSIKA